MMGWDAPVGFPPYYSPSGFPSWEGLGVGRVGSYTLHPPGNRQFSIKTIALGDRMTVAGRSVLWLVPRVDPTLLRSNPKVGDR